MVFINRSDNRVIMCTVNESCIDPADSGHMVTRDTDYFSKVNDLCATLNSQGFAE